MGHIKMLRGLQVADIWSVLSDMFALFEEMTGLDDLYMKYENCCLKFIL
jgi:hypothetical protein